MVQSSKQVLPMSLLSDNSLNSWMANQPNVLNSDNHDNTTVHSFNDFNSAPGSSFASLSNNLANQSNSIKN